MPILTTTCRLRLVGWQPPAADSTRCRSATGTKTCWVSPDLLRHAVDQRLVLPDSQAGIDSVPLASEHPVGAVEL